MSKAYEIRRKSSHDCATAQGLWFMLALWTVAEREPMWWLQAAVYLGLVAIYTVLGRDARRRESQDSVYNRGAG